MTTNTILSVSCRLPGTVRLVLASLAIQVSIGIAESNGQNYFPTFPGRLADDSSSTIPFSTGTNSPVRFQQVYDAAGFTSEAGTRPFLIRSIRFREDEGHQFGFASSFTDFQVNLSTTSRSVDGLSTIFRENVGANDTVIVPRGPFTIGVSDVVSFSAIIFLPEPFYYDPAQGNLLLDIRNFGGGRTSWGVPPFMGLAYVDASNVTEDSVSSVFANSVGADSGTTSTLGLVTQFQITPVPEPSMLSLLGVAVALFMTGKASGRFRSWMRIHRGRHGRRGRVVIA
jgi:hypothetical protein